MIPEFPGLKPLGAEDHNALAEAYHVHSPATCDANPASLFMWRDCQRPMLTRIRGNLCILMRCHAESHYFLEPYGRQNLVDTVRTCLGNVGLVSRVQAQVAAKLSPEEFEIDRQRDTFDYIYRVQTLAELKGKQFDGKRNHIRRFARDHPDYKFRPLELSHLRRAAALFEAWSSARENGNSSSRASASLNHDCQRRALERAFEGYAQLGLIGGAIVAAGEMQGFVVASRGAGNSVIAHFCYANAELPGIYQTLLWEACRKLFSSFTHLNMEEDLGIAGLRKTKLSWHPLRLEEKFGITLRSPGGRLLKPRSEGHIDSEVEMSVPTVNAPLPSRGEPEPFDDSIIL